MKKLAERARPTLNRTLTTKALVVWGCGCKLRAEAERPLTFCQVVSLLGERPPSSAGVGGFGGGGPVKSVFRESRQGRVHGHLMTVSGL